MSSPSWSCLMSCITSLCALSCWYPSRAANLSHSALPAGLRRRRCENCVIRTGLVRRILVDDDAFPDGRGELWVTSLAILACCRSAPAATPALNSLNSVSCLKSPVVLIHHLGVQRLVHNFLIRTLLLLLILHFFGIANVLSMHLFNLLSAHTQYLLDVAVPPKTPSLPESCSLILQFFLFDVNLGSTSTWCSLVFDVVLLTSWSPKFLRGFASVSVCDTACSCSMPALHFAVVREIELLSPTSHSCRLREWLVVPVVIVHIHLLSGRKLSVLVFQCILGEGTYRVGYRVELTLRRAMWWSSICWWYRFAGIGQSGLFNRCWNISCWMKLAKRR